MGSGIPNIVEGEAPTLGASGTDPDAYGKRKYAFQIAATLTTPLPPTDIIAVRDPAHRSLRIVVITPPQRALSARRCCH